MFSDCIVLSTELDNFSELIKKIRNLIEKLIKIEVFVRGGIARGKLEHNKTQNLLIGEAMISAYLLEENIANYPRIIIQNNLREEIEKYNWENDPNNPFIKSYSDGCLGFSQVEKKSNTEKDQKLGLLIKRNLNENMGNPKIFEKYKWLMEEYNMREIHGIMSTTKIQIGNNFIEYKLFAAGTEVLEEGQ